MKLNGNLSHVLPSSLSLSRPTLMFEQVLPRLMETVRHERSSPRLAVLATLTNSGVIAPPTASGETLIDALAACICIVQNRADQEQNRTE